MGERRWIGLTALAVGIAAATVAVPPLIAPRHAEPITASSGPPPARGSAVAPSFTALHIQAEDPANQLTGGASAVGCPSCHGGRRVRYMCADCRLTVHATLPVAGPREITVWYTSDGDRRLKVSVNGAAPRTFDAGGPDWTAPRSLRFTADLPAGELRLTLYNDESPAPDLDEVVIA